MGSRVVGWPGRQIGSGCVKWVGWCVDKWVDGRMGGCVGGRGRRYIALRNSLFEPAGDVSTYQRGLKFGRRFLLLN